MHNFKELNVWNRPVEFAVEIYSITKTFPDDERLCLVS